MKISNEAFVYNWVVTPTVAVMAKALGMNPTSLKNRATRLRQNGVNVPQKSPGPRARFRRGRKGPMARRPNALIQRAERSLLVLA